MISIGRTIGAVVHRGTNMVVTQHLFPTELGPKCEAGLEAVKVQPFMNLWPLHDASDPLLEKCERWPVRCARLTYSDVLGGEHCGMAEEIFGHGAL